VKCGLRACLTGSARVLRHVQGACAWAVWVDCRSNPALQGLSRALEAASEGVEPLEPPPEEACEAFGLARWVADYRAARPGLAALQAQLVRYKRSVRCSALALTSGGCALFSGQLGGCG